MLWVEGVVGGVSTKIHGGIECAAPEPNCGDSEDLDSLPTVRIKYIYQGREQQGAYNGRKAAD